MIRKWAAIPLISVLLVSGPVLAAEPTSPSLAPKLDWDVTKVRGTPRVIDFRTDEGTAMSVDIAPDATWVIFDLLGRIYRIPVGGGDAADLTPDAGISVSYHPRVSPDGKTIVFVSDRGGQDNLWLMDADGGHPRPLLLDMESRFTTPSWLPDGSAVVVTRREITRLGFLRTDDRLWLVPLSGPPSRLVEAKPSGTSVGDFTGEPRYEWPVASPDGRYVYFGLSDFDGDNRTLRRVELKTGAVQAVTSSPAALISCCAKARPTMLGEAAPELSPDGRWLAFVRKRPGLSQKVGKFDLEPRTALWLRDLTTGQDHVLMEPITPDFMVQHPPWYTRVAPGYAWAKDSRSIVISEGGKLRRVWLADGHIDTIPFSVHVHREISQMARHEGRIEDGPFAPHLIRWPSTAAGGTELAYEAAGFVWAEARDCGPAQRAPVPTGSFALTPTWSPDGQRLAYTTFDGAKGRVWTWKPGDAAALPRTQDAAAYVSPVWSRDGRSLYAYRWPTALAWAPEQPLWELVGIRLNRAAPEVLRTNQRGATLTPQTDGRLCWDRATADGGLEAVCGRPDAPASDTVRAGIAPAAQRAVVSPDGRALLIEQRQDIYLAALPPPEADPIPTLDITKARLPTNITRLSHDGAYFASWSADGRVQFASAGDVRSSTPGEVAHIVSRPVALRLPTLHPAEDAIIAYTGGRLLTMAKRRIVEHGVIVVRGARLACVGAAGDCAIPPSARVMDITGKTVIPGLVDVHAHAHRGDTRGMLAPQRPEDALYMAYGVTTIFDPSNGERKWSITKADMVASGAMVGPRTFSTVEALSCYEEGASGQNLRPILSLADAEEHVARKVRLGVPSIKEFRLCTRAQRQMVDQAARDQNVSVTAEAGDLLYNLGLIMGGHTGWEHYTFYVPLYKDVTEFLGQAGATYSPTITLVDYPHGAALEYFLSRQDILTNQKLRRWYPWQALVARRIFNSRPLNQYTIAPIAQGAADIKRYGGHATIGGHGEVYGIGSHWELWSLAMAMTPMEALEAATLDGARFIGFERDIGSLEQGKLADFDILDANPLDDIHNSVRLRFVSKAGLLYDAGTLDRIWPDRQPYGPHLWANALPDGPEPDDPHGPNSPF